MSLVSRIKLKTPWPTPKFGPGPNAISDSWQRYLTPAILEWAFGDDYENLIFLEVPNLAHQRIDLPYVSFESIVGTCNRIVAEWERCGKIIPNKRMVLIEKRKTNNENT